MRDLNVLLEEAIDMCYELNIPYRKIVEISYNGRIKSAWGRCIKSYDVASKDFVFRIEIQKSLGNEIIFPNKDSILSTIIHEIIHTCVDCFDHGEKFQEYSNAISKRYGINVLIRSDAETKGANTIAYFSTFKYVFVCKKCGAKIGKTRTSDFVKRCSYYTHRNCGGKFERIK